MTDQKNEKKADWRGPNKVMMLRNYQTEGDEELKKGTVYSLTDTLSRKLIKAKIASADAAISDEKKD